MLDCLFGFFLALELDLGAVLSGGGGGGAAEGGSPPPPAAKVGTDGSEVIRATENRVSIATLIADFIMRTSGLPAWVNPPSNRKERPRRAGSIPLSPLASVARRVGLDE